MPKRTRQGGGASAIRTSVKAPLSIRFVLSIVCAVDLRNAFLAARLDQVRNRPSDAVRADNGHEHAVRAAIVVWTVGQRHAAEIEGRSKDLGEQSRPGR